MHDRFAEVVDMRSLVLALALLGAGCASGRVELDENAASDYGDPMALAHARSLVETVNALVAGGGNLGRQGAAFWRVRELGLARYARTAWIDWWTPEKNLVIEVPAAGADGREPLVHVVAHYDKTDVRPDTLVSRLLLDALDPLLSWSYLSSGAVDDASGCAVVLELAREVAEHPRAETYRFVLFGAQASSLHGSRSYVAGLSGRDVRRTRLVVNLDSVGVRDGPNGVLESVDNPGLVDEAESVAARLGFPLERWTASGPFCGDDEPFANGSPAGDVAFGVFSNGLAGLIPQRSWFRGETSLPVVTFSSRDATGVLDALPSLLLPLPVGDLHGPGDDPSRVDPWRLYEQYEIVRALTQPKEEPKPAAAPPGPPTKVPSASAEVEAAKPKDSSARRR